MAYTKTNWTNGTAPAINATNLNKIEQGIKDNADDIDTINARNTVGIVEAGTTSNSWDYRLWSDGTYEAWSSRTFSSIILQSSSQGTYYGADGTKNVPVPLFPNNANTGVTLVIGQENGSSHSSGVYLYNTNSSGATLYNSNFTVVFRAHAVVNNGNCGLDLYIRGTYT